MQAKDEVTAFQANNNSVIQLNPPAGQEAEWVSLSAQEGESAKERS